jgi:PKHD-type hydroxylase
MQNQYTYWYFQNALSLKFCENVIKLGKNTYKEQGITGDKPKSLKELKKVRDCKVAFLNQHWIYKEIHPFVRAANKSAGWNFEWDFTEHVQYTEYKKGQFYGWHCDEWPKPYSDTKKKDQVGKNRKLSITVSLSDPKDYKGGELEFDLRDRPDGKPNIIKCKEIMPRGSMVVFPSYRWHRVTAVTKGVRYSLVAWNLGNPFK